jgi:hypothetical protein
LIDDNQIIFVCLQMNDANHIENDIDFNDDDTIVSNSEEINVNDISAAAAAGAGAVVTDAPKTNNKEDENSR